MATEQDTKAVDAATAGKAAADGPDTTTATATEAATAEQSAEAKADTTDNKPATEDQPAEDKGLADSSNKQAEPAGKSAEKTKSSEAIPTTTTTATASAGTSFSKLADRLGKLTKDADYSEMWGVDLSTQDPGSHMPTTVVLQKYLRANNGDVDAAAKQLTSALQWRKKVDAPSLVNQVFDEDRYRGLGYMTVHKDSHGKETVITWNVYGAVKDNKKTFGNVEDFVQWRSALMELGTQKLNIKDATEAIPDDGPDPYQMIQVHDYLSVSFFRMDPHVKAASRETIDTLAMAYPELLAHKYFVNVPTIMGWMYAAMKLFLAPATLKKFHPMSSGTTLATELTDIVSSLPKEYGGKGASVTEQGEEIKLTSQKADVKKETVAEGAAEAPVAAVKEEPKAEEAKTEEVKATEPEAKVEETKATEPEVKTEEAKADADKKDTA